MKLSKCYSLYYKLFGRKNNKNIMIMFLLSFAFSTLALLLFITSLSEELYKAGSGSNDLTISVMDTYGRTVTSPKLNAYIRELSKEVEVSTERFLPIKNNIGKEEKQIIGNIKELIPKLTPQERNNLLFFSEGMALIGRRREEEREESNAESKA